MPTPLLRVILHHSEAADPTLVRWLRDEIDHLFGFPPIVYVVVLGAGMVAFPLALLWFARRRRDELPGA
jgi:hypothetical protein